MVFPSAFQFVFSLFVSVLLLFLMRPWCSLSTAFPYFHNIFHISPKMLHLKRSVSLMFIMRDKDPAVSSHVPNSSQYEHSLLLLLMSTFHTGHKCFMFPINCLSSLWNITVGKNVFHIQSDVSNKMKTFFHVFLNQFFVFQFQAPHHDHFVLLIM